MDEELCYAESDSFFKRVLPFLRAAGSLAAACIVHLDGVLAGDRPPDPPILLLKDALELCELAGVSSTVVAWR